LSNRKTKKKNIKKQTLKHPYIHHNSNISLTLLRPFGFYFNRFGF